MTGANRVKIPDVFRLFPQLLALFAIGCVLPVGPEFQDPEPNVPPSIFVATPPSGEILLPGQTISVSVRDPNLSDTLYVRWLVDYPPARSQTALADKETIVPPQNMDPVRILRAIVPDCDLHNIASGFSTHQWMLAVADRDWEPFSNAPSQYRFDDVTQGGFVVRATWTLQVACAP